MPILCFMSRSYNFAHYPSIDGAVAELKKGNRAYCEPIIHFLEIDPYEYGSGYVKEKVWRYLQRVELTEKQKERLRQVALHYVRNRMSREFFPMCRFMHSIKTQRFEHQVEQLMQTPDARVHQRAKLLKIYLRSIAAGDSARCGW